MGYTHYWNPGSRHFSDAQWANITADAKTLMDHLPEHSNSSGDYYRDALLIVTDENGGPAIINSSQIFLNGDDEQGLAHETFSLQKTNVDSRSYEFCKTARKPYDLVVQAILLLAKKYAPDLVLLSDGNSEDWQSAADLIFKVFGYRPDISVFDKER